MRDIDRPYITFLLRLWRVQGEAPWLWRASLESAETAERHGFASLDALFAFLRGLTSDSAEERSPVRVGMPDQDA